MSAVEVEIEKKKRPANSPLMGDGKERKESDINSSPLLKGYLDAVALTQSANQSYASVASAAAAAKNATPVIKPLTSAGSSSLADKQRENQDSRPDTSIFKTQKPDGAFRDEIVVEVNLIDGEPFKGTLTTLEAIKTIFINTLGFSKSDLGSLTIGYSMGRIVTFKLLSQFNIDLLESVENFDFKRVSKNRAGESIESTISCKIRGIRRVRANDFTSTSNYTDQGYRWVKIEGCEYRVSKQELQDWMAELGEVSSDITEDKLDCDFGSDSDGEDHAIGSGTYSVKMKLVRDIPQFLPMCGKRVRLYHRGIVKLCTNCFGAHQRKVCNSVKVPWIEYVDKFMKDYPSIPEAYYGRWLQMVKNWRESNTSAEDIQNNPPDQKSNERNEQGPLSVESVKSIDPVESNPKSTSPVVGDSEFTLVTKKDARTRNPNASPDDGLITRLRKQGIEISQSVIANQKTSDQQNGPSTTTGTHSSKPARGRGRGGRSISSITS